MNLLFHQGALGDWVLTWPVLRALAAKGWTGAVTGHSRGRLAAALIPRVQPIEVEAAWCRNLFQQGTAEKVAKEIGRLLNAIGPHGSDVHEAPRPTTLPGTTGGPQPPDSGERLVISFVSNGKDAWADNMRAILQAVSRPTVGKSSATSERQTLHRLFFVDPRPPTSWHHHAVDSYLTQLTNQGLTLTPPAIQPQLTTDGPVVIHPGSGGLAKQWPTERFEELMAELRRQGLEVKPILGEAELERWPQPLVARWMREYRVRTLAGVDELRAVLRGASLFVGNDAGPTHLASQMGLPTVALFGPTDPAVWAPVGPRVAILAPPHPTAMHWLAVGDVLAACLRPRYDIVR